MAKVSSRVVMNKAALAALDRGIADALGDMARTIVEAAEPNDAAPYGEGLRDARDWGVWANGRKVDGTAQKPKAARVSRGEIVALGGFGTDHAMHHEIGTEDTGAYPFLSPALMAHQPQAGQFLRKHVMRAVGGPRGAVPPRGPR